MKNKEISKLKKKNKKLTKQKNEILASSSWWITGPLRKIKYNAKKVFKLKDKVDSKIKPSNDETSKSSSSKPKA